MDMSASCSELAAISPLERRLEREGDEGEKSRERGDGEGGEKVVVIVKCLHLERHGVGLAADVTRDDADGPEFARGARVAEQHAIEQAEADVWKRNSPEGLPAGSAERERR